jgi:hypothetical protein
MKKRGIKSVVVAFLVMFPQVAGYSFGFLAHRQISRMAVFSLPAPLSVFYKNHIDFISDRSVDPDRMSYIIPGEAQRHFIDADHFGLDQLPRQWKQAVEKYSEDSLHAHGILPWHILIMLQRLTSAFSENDQNRILRYSAWLSHYIADACTPLHTTKYYNGKTIEQRGIHSLWESRIPELLSDSFDFFSGKAGYIERPLERIWQIVEISHLKVDTVYEAFNKTMEFFSADKVYTHDNTGRKVFSAEFTSFYNNRMNQMVERQMCLAISTTADFWYTAWVNAGQPDLEFKKEKKRKKRMLY